MKFMETKDIPKRYGGDLEWEWGELPHLDDETRAAVETDGNKGWVRGPCLWLDGQRVVVGSEKGKLRRPDSDIEKKKPVVYAADYTEVPVHPDRKLSLVRKKSEKIANGTASPHHHAEEAAAAATGGVTTATIIESNTDSGDAQVTPPPPQTPTNKPEQLNTDGKNLHASPMDGSPVHVPDSQPAAPAITAEYISTISVPHDAASVSEIPAPPPNTQEPSRVSSPQPQVAALPQSGPAPPHAVAMTQAIAAKLQGESVSTIPAVANGHAAGGPGHPEITVASDPSKGLAIETEKLVLTDHGSGSEKGQGLDRPPMERFVTAAEA